jgi:hypothetical protein
VNGIKLEGFDGLKVRESCIEGGSSSALYRTAHANAITTPLKSLQEYVHGSLSLPNLVSTESNQGQVNRMSPSCVIHGSAFVELWIGCEKRGISRKPGS